jgi:hypothetical protein
MNDQWMEKMETLVSDDANPVVRNFGNAFNDLDEWSRRIKETTDPAEKEALIKEGRRKMVELTALTDKLANAIV